MDTVKMSVDILAAVGGPHEEDSHRPVPRWRAGRRGCRERHRQVQRRRETAPPLVNPVGRARSCAWQNRSSCKKFELLPPPAPQGPTHPPGTRFAESTQRSPQPEAGGPRAHRRKFFDLSFAGDDHAGASLPPRTYCLQSPLRVAEAVKSMKNLEDGGIFCK